MTDWSGAGAPAGGFELTGEPVSTRQLLRDLWGARELVFMLSRKEFFVKFRRTSGGLLWSILLPIAQATLMATVLSKIVRFDTEVSYAVFIYAGLIAFNFVANGLGGGVGSLVDGSGLSTKIYFPRLVFPLVVVGAGFYGLVPGLAVLVAMAAILDAPLGLDLLLLVPAVVLLCVFAASCAAVLSVAQVYVRDLRYVVQATVQPLFYVTPVLYPLSAIDRFRTLLRLNPVTGVVEIFHAAIGAHQPGWLIAVATTCVWSVVLFSLAIAIYRRHDRVAVDRL